MVAPLSFSPSLVSQVPMVPNLVIHLLLAKGRVLLGLVTRLTCHASDGIVVSMLAMVCCRVILVMAMLSLASDGAAEETLAMA
jgi:hypothetical protein